MIKMIGSCIGKTVNEDDEIGKVIELMIDIVVLTVDNNVSLQQINSIN